MLKTFVLLASIWNPELSITDTYMLDYNMSGTDCTDRLLEVYHSETMEIEPGVFVYPGDYVLSCEVDELF